MLLFLLACGGTTAPAACLQYAACQAVLADTEADRVLAEQTYGADGTCWAADGNAELCLAECNDRNASIDSEHPDCGAPPATTSPSSGTWVLVEHTFLQNDCDDRLYDDWEVVSSPIIDQGPFDFTLSRIVTAPPFELACSVLNQDVTCESRIQEGLPNEIVRQLDGTLVTDGFMEGRLRQTGDGCDFEVDFKVWSGR